MYFIMTYKYPKLETAKQVSNFFGYNPNDLKSSNKFPYKLMIKNEDGNYIHFGDRRYKDFLIYLGENDKDFAKKRRNYYAKRHKKIDDNDFSKNNLSRRILWVIP